MDKKNIKSKRKAALIALVVIFAVSAAAELIINAGREGTADVYVQIRCDEVSEAPEKLTDQALVGYIPEDGVAMAKAGEIQGVGIAHRKDSEYLKSLPDGTEDNNLGNLPSVSG